MNDEATARALRVAPGGTKPRHSCRGGPFQHSLSFCANWSRKSWSAIRRWTVTGWSQERCCTTSRRSKSFPK